MKIDASDINLLVTLHNRQGKHNSVRAISKSLISDDKKGNDEELDRLDKNVRYRLKKYVKNGLVNEENNDLNTKTYSINTDKVWMALVMTPKEGRQLIVEIPNE